jgi:hypothetical protein
MWPFLREIVGAIVWALANAVYIDMRRKGTRGFGRFAAFWAGLPVNFVWMALVKEGKAALVEPPSDDYGGELMREIWRDREAKRMVRNGEAAEKD